ncbi:MAG: InlB B-repeat-containing protein [Clostridia bacterium]|nr:InlB B-repeat-containing protein [Clostridia bacterium]
MKKLFTGILSVLLLIVLSVFGLTGCGSNDKQTKKISLDVTAKTLAVGESFTLTATTTPADATVTWSSSDEAIVTVDNGNVLGVSEGSATVTAKNDTVTATCEITVTAAAEQKYTILFKNGDVDVKSMEISEGATVSYNGIAPTKASTEEYSYTFIGWSLTDGGEVVDISTITVDGDKTFYAVFSQSVREYTVTWNVNGETTTETYAYGATPDYKNGTPIVPSVGTTSYTFLGWADTISGNALETLPAVTDNVTYYAVFEEVTAQTKFTVTWMNGETLLKTDVDVEYETQPEYVGETPTKDMTTECEYVFVGWATSADGEKLETLPVVTANATFYAVFEETARKYTVTWVIEGVEETSQVGYGSVPAYLGTPEKADSADCSFKFIGWALSAEGEALETLPEVSGDATYYAVFDVDEVFAAPKFLGGAIDYSANSEEIFLPDGLLGEGVTLVSAVVKAEGQADVVAYENGAWVHSAITLTEEELKGNLIGARTLEVQLSSGEEYSVAMNVYAGIINELSDFPMFFNNTGVDSTVTNETTGEVTEYKGVAPYTYGYYIVTEDLGSYTISLNASKEEVYTYADELSFEQVEATDYQATNGFNGVLDGQGHTLKFKLMSGGLVGLVLGNAVIKNLAVIYEDATSTYYGAFGYITNGHPEIRNCYIERTNNHYQAWSVFGIMSRPNAKLVLHNTVVYGYNTSNNSAKNSNMWIDASSTNAYVIHARTNATNFVNIKNFTKVFNDGVLDGSREVLLSEIEDTSGFDDNYWSKENGKLIWKGFETATVTWVKGEETVTELTTKGDWLMYTQTLPENVENESGSTTYYWSKSEDGEAVSFSDRFKVDEDVTYYMVTKQEIRYYTVTWIIDGVETTTDYQYNEVVAHDDPVKAEDNYYTYKFLGWSYEENGELVELGTATEEFVYYAVFEKTAKFAFTTVSAPILYSTDDANLFLPEELTVTIDAETKISSADGAVVYYENGAWAKNFAITDEQRKANAIATFDVAIVKGENAYIATVKSYAGVIDELSDFPKFFDNDPSATHPNVYGYYIVVKDLGSYTIDGQTYTYADDLTMTQSMTTDYTATNGFNGVLDGAGHTLKFNLLSGGLVGNILGGCTIKNLAVFFNDSTSTYYGVFGYMAMTAGPVIENCYIEQTNNHYQKRTTFGIMGRPLGRLILKNTVVYGFNNNHANNYNGEASAPISTASTNAYVICGRAAVTPTLPQATGFTKVYDNGSGLPYDANDNKLYVPLADIADASGFNAYWSQADDKLTWQGATDTTVYSVVAVK